MIENKRIAPGYKLALAGPNFISLAAIEVTTEAEGDSYSLNRPLLNSLMQEYLAIYILLLGMVGSDRLVVTKNVGGDYSKLPSVLKRELTREIPDLHPQQIPSLPNNFQCWPRDAHTYIGGQFFPRTKAWKGQFGYIRGSWLGEGGRVLTSGNTALVGDESWYNFYQEEINSLRERGCKVSYLEPPNDILLPGNRVPGHLDSDAALIQDQSGKPFVLVSSSYYNQYKEAKEVIDNAAKEIEGEVVVIEDQNLPHQAFNLIQFNDLSIAMTGGAKRLENTLRELLGDDKIHTTRIPIKLIPSELGGSIRCLTNLVPQHLLDSRPSVLFPLTVRLLQPRAKNGSEIVHLETNGF